MPAHLMKVRRVNIVVSPLLRNVAAAGHESHSLPGCLPCVRGAHACVEFCRAASGKQEEIHAQGAHFGQSTNFSTTPGDSAREGYRVRLPFNGPGASSGRIVCAGEPAVVAPSPESGDVRLLAAFCNGEYPLSYLSAHVSGIQDAHDPAFRDFVRQVATNLFPPQNRQEQDRNNCVPPGDC